MKRIALAACLLSLSGLAAAQQLPPDDFTTDFARISPGRVFTVEDFDTMVYGAMVQHQRPGVPLASGLDSLDESVPLILIEEEGIRLPEQTLGTVSP